MKIQEIQNERLSEKIFKIDHRSGLTIYVCPKEGYQSTYAIFGTQYGSIDTKFRRKGEKEWTTVPEGIAHYLEHKLFESEDGDAFARYAKTGASANAYTSFDQTCYLFSCTENFDQSLEILLDFVQSPYFTEETVRKEQGIIGQEIRMYDDAPDWRVQFNLLAALYQNHPVRIDIAGTVESIAQIDAELLYRCYRTFYSLKNMVLTVAGKVTVDQVLAVADRMLKPNTPIEIERGFVEEPDDVMQSRVEQRLAVTTPLFTIGFKEHSNGGIVPASQVAYTNILLEMLTGKASPLYRRLVDEGLINDNFGAEYFEGRGYSAPLIAGESKDPDAVDAAIKKEIVRMREQGVDAEAFETARRTLYGQVVMGFNSVDNLANRLASCHFTGRGLYDMVECIANATKEDVEKRLKESFDEKRSALSIILPA